MEFDKNRVFTSLNADKVQIGSKGYFSESLSYLKDQVKYNYPTEVLTEVLTEDRALRFYTESSRAAWHLFYLVEEPSEETLCTRRDLARWLAEGRGEYILSSSKHATPSTDYGYNSDYAGMPVTEAIRVRRWTDTDWHEPTLEYMEIE